jgi:flagellar basal-body rod protein FlgB
MFTHAFVRRAVDAKVSSMDLQKQPLFQMAQQKMGYLGQRTKVLAQNVANADTPNYRARDLKPVNFQEELKRTNKGVTMVATQANHLPPVSKPENFRSLNNRSYEASISKNNVVLEEQMMKLGETQGEYEATTTLYRKYIDMMKLAVGRSQ